jgi:hypothetical protein
MRQQAMLHRLLLELNSGKLLVDDRDLRNLLDCLDGAVVLLDHDRAILLISVVAQLLLEPRF